MEAICSYETSVLTRATRHKVPKDIYNRVLHCSPSWGRSIQSIPLHSLSPWSILIFFLVVFSLRALPLASSKYSSWPSFVLHALSTSSLFTWSFCLVCLIPYIEHGGTYIFRKQINFYQTTRILIVTAVIPLNFDVFLSSSAIDNTRTVTAWELLKSCHVTSYVMGGFCVRSVRSRRLWGGGGAVIFRKSLICAHVMICIPFNIGSYGVRILSSLLQNLTLNLNQHY
jgi:hypothetical protein